ncbi:pyruvate kinase [Kiloniella laminariae]|uniref:Pyruvate kinase n=1 Tax=Kiloniella laminariae TaxID=454162 RepID=A0ABT4LKB4_9PROT|nr:pyruvate kinase [Kiloniella laminariae]MCZ4281526.1 pyruvate kinase [Kiloniella laminariae]
MKRKHLCKIVATLGPASSDKETIAALFKSGVDTFRLNFSHGTHEDHKKRYDLIREVEQETGRPIAVLMDLQGPKLRVGRFAEGSAELKTGATFRLDMKDELGDATRATLPHKEIFDAIEAGTDLLLDDGRIRLRVRSVKGTEAETEVVVGGVLSNNKGVNVPGVVLPLSALTEKDLKDMEFGLELGCDWCALSFVQRPEDVMEARKLVNGRAGVMAKLEKPSAIEQLEAIVALTDAVMVARGDLGVELPPENVPVLQKRIIRMCREHGKPVIVATQMLETMVTSPTPTRAEASDVATAVYDGADAVMLSAESASGAYPLEAVSMMNRIIETIEQDPLYLKLIHADELEPNPTEADAISDAASQVADLLGAKAIVTFTTTGSTAFRAARCRPKTPLLGLTPDLRVARRMSLIWGVHSVNTRDVSSFAEMVGKSTRIARREGFCENGDKVVVTAGIPFGTPGSTNNLRIATVGQHEKTDRNEA